LKQRNLERIFDRLNYVLTPVEKQPALRSPKGKAVSGIETDFSDIGETAVGLGVPIYSFNEKHLSVVPRL